MMERGELGRRVSLLAQLLRFCCGPALESPARGRRHVGHNVLGSRGRSGLCGALLVVLVTGCIHESPEDARRLHAIRTQYGARLKVAIDDQLYLSARSVGVEPIDEPLARQLFAQFFLGGQVLRATDVVYLNVYDASSRFQYQLYCDPTTGAIVRQDGVEHY